MSAFIRLLWSGRDRKVNPALQERIAAYSLRAFWDVKATPVKCPITYCNHDDRSWRGTWIDGRLVCVRCGECPYA